MQGLRYPLRSRYRGSALRQGCRGMSDWLSQQPELFRRSQLREYRESVPEGSDYRTLSVLRLMLPGFRSQEQLRHCSPSRDHRNRHLQG